MGPHDLHHRAGEQGAEAAGELGSRDKHADEGAGEADAVEIDDIERGLDAGRGDAQEGRDDDEGDGGNTDQGKSPGIIREPRRQRPGAKRRRFGDGPGLRLRIAHQE